MFYKIFLGYYIFLASYLAVCYIGIYKNIVNFYRF